MAYCTIDQLIDLFGEEEIVQLSNLYNPAETTIDETRVEAAAKYADDEINSYLGMRFTLPLTAVPLVLTSKAADIMRYQMDAIAPRDDVRKRYEDAVKWLRMVADGKIDLGLAQVGDALEPAGDNAFDVDALIPDPVFTWEGY